MERNMLPTFVFSSKITFYLGLFKARVNVHFLDKGIVVASSFTSSLNIKRENIYKIFIVTNT